MTDDLTYSDELSGIFWSIHVMVINLVGRCCCVVAAVVVWLTILMNEWIQDTIQ